MASTWVAGDRLFLRYGRWRQWHERILLHRVEDNLWYIVTPDFDIYPENIKLHLKDSASGEICGIRFQGQSPGVPAGLDADDLYRFGAVTKLQLASLVKEGSQCAAEEAKAAEPVEKKKRRGAGAKAGAAPADDGAVVAVPDDGAVVDGTPVPMQQRWRAMEAISGIRVGEVVKLRSDALVGFPRALQEEGGRRLALAVSDAPETEAQFLERLGLGTGSATPRPSDDARIMPVITRADDEARERSWTSVCSCVTAEVIKGFGVRGPRTSMWCVRFLERQQMHPDDYHSRFKIRHKLTVSDWGVLQHSLALRCVALAGCIDQLDLPNLAIVEVLFREAQIAEYYYRQIERDDLEKSRLSKKAGDRGLGVDEVEYFQGAEKTAHDTMIAPDLVEWISKQGERDSSIMKNMRKAREERALAKK